MLLVAPAPAKLNLALELTGRRPNGYHEIAAVSQTIDWSDLVGAVPGPREVADGACHLTVRGPGAGEVPHGPDNIVARTAGLLVERGIAAGGPLVVLWKRIPTQSGLGGGSADAATLIRLLSGGGQSEAAAEVGLRAGADVPFALHGGAGRVSGIGELLEPLPALRPCLILVAMLGRVPTAVAYSSVRPHDFSDGSRAAAVADRLAAGRVPEPELLGSALQAAALRAVPRLGERLDRLRAATRGVSWAMTGSGGAFFSIMSDPGRAPEIARAAIRALPDIPFRAVLPLCQT